MTTNRRPRTHDTPSSNRAPSSSKRYLVLFLLGLAVTLAIAGFLAYRAFTPDAQQGDVPVIEGVQEVRMRIVNHDYFPSTMTVTAGQKVRWVIDSTEATGCTRSIVSPGIGVRQGLVAGENVIEFTPTRRGAIPFSCAMGMTSGEFQVI